MKTYKLIHTYPGSFPIGHLAVLDQSEKYYNLGTTTRSLDYIEKHPEHWQHVCYKCHENVNTCKTFGCKQAIFITEDGVDIYPGDEYWDRDLDNEPRKNIAYVYSYDTSNYTVFSTSEAAWKYIKEMEVIHAENYENEIREAALEYLRAVKSPALNTSWESFDIGIFRAGVLFAKGKDYIPQ